jgi:hypothetical protein
MSHPAKSTVQHTYQAAQIARNTRAALTVHIIYFAFGFRTLRFGFGWLDLEKCRDSLLIS